MTRVNRTATVDDLFLRCCNFVPVEDTPYLWRLSSDEVPIYYRAHDMVLYCNEAGDIRDLDDSSTETFIATLTSMCYHYGLYAAGT